MKWNPWAEAHCSHHGLKTIRWMEPDGTAMIFQSCEMCGMENKGPVLGVEPGDPGYPLVGLTIAFGRKVEEE